MLLSSMNVLPFATQNQQCQALLRLGSIALAEGLTEGEAKGKAVLLITLLQNKFSKLSPRVCKQLTRVSNQAVWVA